MFSTTRLLLATAAICALGMPLAAHAAKKPGDFPRPSSGCPDNHDQMSFPGDSTKYCRPKGGKPSSGSSSSSAPRAGYTEPFTAAFAKPSATTRCPTGYRTDQANELQCGTRPDDTPPKAARKTGACPAGTVEEWGAFCTTKPTDVSDAAIGKLEGYHIADFNMVFLQMQLARMPVDKLGEWEPEVLKAMKAERAASGNPYKTASQRAQEKDAPAQAAAQKASNDEAAAKDRSRNEAMRSACQQQMAAGLKSDPCMEFAAAGGMTVPGATAGVAAASPQAAVKEEAVKALGGMFKGLLKP